MWRRAWEAVQGVVVVSALAAIAALIGASAALRGLAP